MTENTLTEQDIADLESLAAESENHTLLEVWREILSNIDEARKEKITPTEAVRIVTAWRHLSVQDVAVYQPLYYDRLDEMRQVLLVEIESDPAALKNTENDAEDNHHHYLNLLLQWQLLAQSWGADWDVSSPTSHIDLAAFAEAQNFVLGERGLIGQLEAIGFDFTDEESTALAAELEVARAEL